MSRMFVAGAALAVAALLAPASSGQALAASAGVSVSQQPPAPQPPPKQPPKPGEEEEESPVYEESLVVTASKVEQQLVNAPAAVSVVSSDVIQSTPATNYAELLRSVPGVNIAQTSARDFNITLRGATSTLSTSQLALVDGRSLYLDFFGFVAWDLLPINPSEVRQIEVIRGPASAVWGANAMNGVINFISKTPREMAGDSATVSFGVFDRSTNGSDADSGTMFSISGTHARAVNGRWAYKLSAGGYTSDAFARPTGLIPGTQTAYPAVHQPGDDAAQVRRPRRLRRPRGPLPAGVLGRLRRHRRHHPHRHRAVRHEPRRRPRLRHGPLLAAGAEGQRLHQPAQRRRHGAAVLRPRRPADPVQLPDPDARRRSRQRPHRGHAPGPHLRRQRPLQQLRSVDRAARRQPHRGRRLHPGRAVSQRFRAAQRRRPARQVRRDRRPGVLATGRADPEATAGSRRAAVVQQGVPVAVAHQQLPRRRHRQSARFPGAGVDQPGVRAARHVQLPGPGDRQRGR